MAEAVYILCMLTSLACALLLGRAYRRTGMRLLLWSCLCFLGLTLNNALLYADKVIWPTPDIDLRVYRNMATLCGLGFLVYGLIWDSE